MQIIKTAISDRSPAGKDSTQNKRSGCERAGGCACGFRPRIVCFSESSKITLISLLISAALIVATGTTKASDPIKVVVIRENAVGTSAQAQPYLDDLLAQIARKNGWQSVEGKYLNNREKGLRYIEKEQPDFGILSLATFLALRENHKLKVIGQVLLSVPGGSQYYIVGKGTADLASCKQQLLASNHIRDSKFIENVAAKRAFKLSEFKTLQTERPIQTIKTVIRDQAKCALIDDAQMSELDKIEGGAELKPVWKSQRLPPMPVVAFQKAGKKETRQFQDTLAGLCRAKNQDICKNVGISSLKVASDSQYAQAVAAYSK
ncbi:MAG: hypothetical protein JXA30_03955 [Deltaproteobacteria bacterium]|nr:hypothetical protein [Deltaproteobacteria bacterium]